MADEGQKRKSDRKSITAKDAPEANASGGARRGSIAKKDVKSDEIKQVGKQDAVQPPQPPPGDLAGTLQSLFTQTEHSEAPTLKPLRRPKLIYENTFRLWPYKPFNNDKVRMVLQITLEEMLSKVHYKSDASNDIATKVAERVRGRVLSFRFDRYKIIVLTTMGPLNRQGMHIGMRCLWDPQRDSYVSYTYKNPSIYCNCCVYGIYFE